ncbi:MAG: hypothetical protein JXR76_31095 [Deltaproteobacteria bacterium]|nr:hypothetical protein [Deltaproteobacteria bacterium]
MEFKIQLQRDPQQLFQKIRNVSKNKMEIIGDVSGGQFQGMFCGDYKLLGKTASIRIQQKPAYISWKIVQKGIDYLGRPSNS